VISIWVLLPSFVALHDAGLTFGLVNLGNSDQPNYVLAAQNLAASGFSDSHHVANIDMGLFSHRASYVGTIGVINFASAATGLSALQVALACMAVAVCVLAVSLSALGHAIWPLAPGATAIAVVIGTVAGLSVYNYSYYFLGAIFGAAAVSTSAAGSIALARRVDTENVTCIAAGGAFGVYAYGHMELPVLVLLPGVTCVAGLILGTRGWRPVLGLLLRGALAVAGALVLAGPTLDDAVHLVRSQSQALSGWTLPALNAASATIWPGAIVKNSSREFIVVSWVLVIGVLLAGLVAAWVGGERASAALAGLLLAAAILVVLGSVHIWGPDRYQSWKMESFLLPIACVAALPGLGSAAVGFRRAGRGFMLAAAGGVLLSPWLLWVPVMSFLTPAITSASLMRLESAPELSNVAVVNIRLPYPVLTMEAASVLDKSVVVFTQLSYYGEMTSLDTCTLTMRSMLSPGDTEFTDLGGGYVLLDRPHACAMKK
jgi:hypothetical protein